jgi:hypothetical protein
MPVRSTKLLFCYLSQLRVGYHQLGLQCRHLRTAASPSRTPMRLRYSPRPHAHLRWLVRPVQRVACPSGTLAIDLSRARLPARFSSDRTSLLGLTVPRASAQTSSRDPINHSSHLRCHRTARCQRDYRCGAVDVHISVSLISVEQAQRDINKEIPDGTITLKQTMGGDQVQIQGHVRHFTRPCRFLPFGCFSLAPR